MSARQMSDLLRVRTLQASRAQHRLAEAIVAEQAARTAEAATQSRTAQSALDREATLSDMGRQTGAPRDIFRFAALTEDHAVMLDREAAERARAADESRHCGRLVEEGAGAARQAQRVQEKASELLTLMRRADARKARRVLARREEENARCRSI